MNKEALKELIENMISNREQELCTLRDELDLADANDAHQQVAIMIEISGIVQLLSFYRGKLKALGDK